MKGVIPMVADDLFVHFRNDKTLRYRMHGKAQDAVVARFGQDLRNVAFTVPSLKYNSAAISLRVFASQTNRRILISVSLSAEASEKMLWVAFGKVE